MTFCVSVSAGTKLQHVTHRLGHSYVTDGVAQIAIISLQPAHLRRDVTAPAGRPRPPLPCLDADWSVIERCTAAVMTDGLAVVQAAVDGRSADASRLHPAAVVRCCE